MIELLVLRIALLSALVLLVCGLTWRKSASVRHGFVVAGLVAMLAAPFLGAVFPEVRLPILPANEYQFARTSVAQTPRVYPKDPLRPFFLAESNVKHEVPTTPPWTLFWGLGMSVVLGRYLFSWGRLAFRMRTARRVNELKSIVPVYESSQFETPFVAFVGRSVIVLPEGWRSWPPERLEVVMRHEETHLRRGDLWSLHLSRLTCAVLWPNPFAWWLAATEGKLSERATDDGVLATGIPAWRYAEELLSIAREPVGTGPIPALGMVRKAEIAQRVEMILNPKVPRKIVSSGARRTILAAALVVTVPVSTWALVRPALLQKVAPIAPTQRAPKDAPVQILLKTWVIKTTDSARKRIAVSDTEPKFGTEKLNKVVSAPILRTLGGQKATITVMLDGSTSGAELTATLDKKGKYKLSIVSFLCDEGPLPNNSREPMPKFLRSFKETVTIGEKGYVRFWLPDPSGEFHGYQMVVQPVKVTDQ